MLRGPRPQSKAAMPGTAPVRIHGLTGMAEFVRRKMRAEGVGPQQRKRVDFVLHALESRVRPCLLSAVVGVPTSKCTLRSPLQTSARMFARRRV